LIEEEQARETKLASSRISERRGMNHELAPGDAEDPVPEAPSHYRLLLYVAGQTARSVTALHNLRRVCEAHLAGNYTIEVIDLIQQPHLAAGHQVVAIPTLIRKLPEPVKRLIR